jgi:sulfur carrier protein ThiS
MGVWILEIEVIFRDEKLLLTFEGSAIKVKDILDKLSLSEKVAFVVKNDEIADINEKVCERDKVEVISVVSGG